ncbi:MAG: cytochrome c3 family protein, partial [Bacillota bacterium]
MRLPASLRRWPALRAAARGLAVVALLATSATAVRYATAAYTPPPSNIAITAHNLSKSGTKTVTASTETEICAFCHTPHSANTALGKPLWNRNSSGSTYTRYTSGSLDASNIVGGFNDQPAGSSLLCLSCHDGMVALGNVNVLRGQSASITLNNTNSGNMPTGVGAQTGFTRVIGTDLSNDHPISITYNSDLTTADNRGVAAAEELRRLDDSQRYPSGDPAAGTSSVIGMRSSGVKPLLPLEGTGKNGAGQVQCTTCHDPHITADKFLRLNRFQLAAPSTTGFDAENDQICLACHPKLGAAWATSAHANSVTADEVYTTEAAALRQFSVKGQVPAVWQVGCLNCHDTHSVQGSRRLLREGVNGDPLAISSGTAAGAAYQAGYASQTDNQVTSAIENTCFQCHRDAGTDSKGVKNALVAATGSTVPSIKSLFDLTYGMPIKTVDQANGTKEVHNIYTSDFLEDPVNLGQGNNANRHVECTDCHNPHRVRRGRTFVTTSSNTAGDDGALRTHTPGGKTGDLSTGNGNIASGVLRGSWGVEPTMPAISYTSWPSVPTGFDVKKGDPGSVAAPTTRAETLTATYLTREYQLCFKCHSNYANGPLATDFPALEYSGVNCTSRRCTPKTLANGMTRYTNVAAEFLSVTATDPPTTGTDQGEFANGTS